MKKLYIVSAILTIFAFPLTACGTQTPPTPQIPVIQTSILETPPADIAQTEAVYNIRVTLGLPNLTLESKGMDTMINSPSGDLPVAIYIDSEGRKYSVEPRTNTVVEIDARNLLASIPANAPSISQAELRTKAMGIARATTPDFDSLLPSLIDNGGSKGDYYFFDWRKFASPNGTMPPFFQIAFDKSGLIFAYINTLSLK